ncbi:MAG: hypothetical protein O7G85_17625 [Planctomycetota bacterium]|nr:hypothetical protein [Planctomycetota bacterium]
MTKRTIDVTSFRRDDFRRRVVVLSILLSLAFVSGLAGQETESVEVIPVLPVLPVFQPDEEITFTPETYLSSLQPGEDGSHVYARLKRPALNVWSILVYYIPAYLWIALTLILLLSLRWLWRTRGMAGVPFCRKCHYFLVKHEGEVCPECGTTLTRRTRVQGRPVQRRMGLAFLALLMGAGAYWLGRDRSLYMGKLSHLFVWRSTTLQQADWVDRHFPGWDHWHKLWIDRLVRIDATTLDIVPVHEFKSNVQAWTIDASGKRLTTLHRQGLWQNDLEGGNVQFVNIPGDGNGEMLMPDLVRTIAHGDSSDVLYVATYYHTFSRWDLKRNTIETLWTTRETDPSEGVGFVTLASRNQMLLHLGGYQGILPAWKVWDEATSALGDLVQPSLGGRFLGMSMALDERTMFRGSVAFKWVLGFDLDTGVETFRSPTWPALRFPGVLGLIGEGRYLVVGDLGGLSAYLLDLETNTWVGELAGLIVRPNQMVVCEQARRLLIYGRLWTMGAGSISVVASYDLDAILKMVQEEESLTPD